MFSNFTTLEAGRGRGKLQKLSTKAQAHASHRDEYQPSLPSSLPSPTSASAASIQASRRVIYSPLARKEGDRRSGIPLPKPAARRAATKSQTGAGDGRRGVVIVDNVVMAKPVNVSARNASITDPAVILSPPRSPNQSSQTAAECSANTALYPTARVESPSSGQPRQNTVPCHDNLKPNGGASTKDLPAAPTTQRQKRQLRCPSRNPKVMQTVLTSSSTSTGGGIAAIAATYLPMLPPTSGQLLRTSTYPIPLVSSPLTDNAISLRLNGPIVHNRLSGSISSDSSSSSLQRLLRRGSQKVSHNRRSLYLPQPTGDLSSPRPSKRDQPDCLSSLPYETLPATGPPPTFVSKLVTPQVIAHATTSVTALPGVAESASLCSKWTRDSKGKRSGGRLWSLLSRNSAKGNAQQGPNESTQQALGQQWTLTKEGPNSCCCDQSHRCARHSSLGKQSLPVGKNDCQHTQVHGQQARYRERYATRPLPRPPLPPKSPNSVDQRLSTNDSEIELEEDNRDAIATQRHRRRALFALDGLTYFGTEVSRRAPPPPPLPSPSKSGSIVHANPPQTVQSVPPTQNTVVYPLTLPPSLPSSTTPSGGSRMSEEVKRAFVRRGREAESRVFSAHVCAEAKARMAVTGDTVSPNSGAPDLCGLSPLRVGQKSNAKIKDRDRQDQSLPDPEKAYSAGVAKNVDQGVGQKELDLSPITTETPRDDLAWWKAEQKVFRVNATTKVAENAASPTKEYRSTRQDFAKETLREDAARDLEFAARASSSGDGEAGPTWFLPLTYDNTGSTRSKRIAPPTPLPFSEQVDRNAASLSGCRSLQSDETNQILQRGRQLARDTFRKHRDAGRWDFAVDNEEKSFRQDVGGLAGNRLHQQPQFKVQIPRRAWGKDDLTASSAKDIEKVTHIALATPSASDYGNSPDPWSASGSTSSSSASLNATVFRVFRGKNDKKDKKHTATTPPLNAFEAAHAVQNNTDAALTPSSTHGLHCSPNPEGARRRDMRPEPLSLRSWKSRTPPSPAVKAEPLVGLGIGTRASEHHGLHHGKTLEGKSVVKGQRHRFPTPPLPSSAPVRTNRASYLPLPFRSVSSAEISQQTPYAKRRPAPPPPPPPRRTTRSPPQSATPAIPPKSALRSLLGGDWSGQDLEKIRHGVLFSAQTPQQRSLSTVAEEAWEFSGRPKQGENDKQRQRQRQEGESVKKVSWAQDCEESNYSSDAGEDEDRFWSDDEDAAAREDGSSKKTTPEKDGVWVPPCWSESFGGRPVGEADGIGSNDAAGAFDESQLLDEYLDAQWDEEEHNVRAAREAEHQLETRAAAEAEEARRREDEARAKRVADLLAKVRAGVMD